MTDNEIEQEIQEIGLTAPRLKLTDIEAAIESETYFTANRAYPGVMPKRMGLEYITICVIVLVNGHRIVGVNAGPVSEGNFDAGLGQKMARQHAIDQIWPLMGFALRERLYHEGTQPTAAPVPNY